MAEPRNRYSQVSLILHWLIALMVIGQIGLIMAHDATDGDLSRSLVMLHKSVGLSILVLTLVRLGWRIANPAIPLPAEMPKWQALLARGTHVLFYLVLIGMPLGGWAASSAAGRDIDFFGLFTIPPLPVGENGDLAGRIFDAHALGGTVFLALIVLHVLGALKHTFVDRSGGIFRMLPFGRA
mgnify:CR=1 FL=1